MDIETKEEALWSLLLYAGYLNVISSEFHDEQLVARISIPNKEVSFVYYKIVKQWFSDALISSKPEVILILIRILLSRYFICLS